MHVIVLSGGLCAFGDCEGRRMYEERKPFCRTTRWNLGVFALGDPGSVCVEGLEEEDMGHQLLRLS
jgi:hypothetical protein